ncbi:nucleotidyl transferase AbiEii/AbiGii toxin family protein [Nitratireductor kimnyeongensis]|uniref:Nucleotidyl transferase AbiEii/AbiGii toxin family protein n=1 Tax=Nitratireductor kimnyeongensis TaxID=430679 RepID=A0ABW0T6X4_9HYPH|nr:nucleotidyl transferase AbiEii/AbiGii toxin family protein [Nitratireductor kimnyeongensis]QZZ34193.1 nucleotidyl transferase AbiEii/AbiGii toxin family protein [Nitratireductor kimnyeongensis]
MIEREEIEAQSKHLDVHVPNVERDYVFGWLLKAFFEHPWLGHVLVFKGGNCMRKAYYPATRFSSDLDFSVTSAIDAERFRTAVNEACLSAQDACGVVFETNKNTFEADRMIDTQRQAFKGKVYFKDFYGQDSNLTISVKLDVTEFDRLLLPVVQRPLIHPYSDAAQCQVNVQCMALEELLANKLKCLLQRRHSFDLYDLVYAAFFERSIEVDRSLVLSTFLRKTIFERSPGSAKQILLGLPMAFFQGVWNKYIVCPVESRFDFDRVAEGFRSAIDLIFGDVQPRGFEPDPFYPAEFRNLILEAGASRRLMNITYDGHQRVIEPYSLAYKRRQDGHASEYFYAWDRTGGRSSPPGIKTFFHHKIQNLSLGEEQFEPRFEIELSRAGEAAQKGYFGKPFAGSGRVPVFGRPAAVQTRARRNPFAQTYTVECPYCQKRFKRTTNSTALNAHKDSNGYPCRSRRGYLV